MRFQRKRETLEAWEVTLGSMDWIAKQVGGTATLMNVMVPTPTGVVRASFDSYVLRHPDGTFEVLSRQQFEEQYEVAS